ncbi:extracellular solute-binding protein [Sphingomonas sp. LY160]|uniref:extracellular solute-binding protein n=1 Tax=Sphingomonas sp. LY160 TaxID=3095342 RepID=UPI002ADEF8F5|nr:extracellular solute-binding protein [Sphingomonas sp. LY160]MEA1072952.1 extracellular solute-binding protein [Sphingomonas sp. LY160]
MSLSRREWMTAAAGVPLMLSACGRGRGYGNAIDMWAMGAEAEKLPDLLAGLARSGQPAVRVQPLPWSAAHEKLLTSFAGNSLPDVGQIGNSWLSELAAIGAILPVPAAMTSLVDGQFEGVVDTNRIGNRLMGLPWYVDTRLQFYRKDLFADAGYNAPPERWDAWKAALHKVKRTKRDGYAVLIPINEYEHLTTMALSAGATFLNPEGTRGAFNSPAFREALSFYKSLYAEGLAPIAGAAQISNVWNEFARGYFAIYPSGPWTIGDMKTRLPAELQDSWATAPFPGPDGPGRSTPGGSSLIVFSRAKDPAAAWRLVGQLLAPATQSRLQVLTGSLPPTRSVWASAKLLDDPITDAFARQLDRTTALPKVPEWERIVTEMQTVAELFVRGRTSIDEAVRDMDRRADRLLEKRRWMISRDRAA